MEIRSVYVEIVTILLRDRWQYSHAIERNTANVNKDIKSFPNDYMI